MAQKVAILITAFFSYIRAYGDTRAQLTSLQALHESIDCRISP